MTDIVSTAIHIQQTPTRRRKSADETTSRTRHVDGLNGGGSAVYYLRHKSASRSLDDLNDITDTDDVVLVNGSPICAGELIGPKTVKSAAVIRLASTTSSEGGERDGYRLSLTKSITLNDTNNNSMITSSTPRDVMGEDNNTMQNKKKRRKLRNKSTSDVIDMNKKQDMSLEESEAVSASVDNIFESGNRKNTESDNETLDGSTLTVSSKSSGIRPKKPKRSNASIKNFDYERARVVIPPLLHIGDSEISKYHRELNTSLDEHNNLSISKENFDAFISREKTKYSGRIVCGSPASCISEDDLSVDFSRVQSWASDTANMSITSQPSLDILDSSSKPPAVHNSKIKELGSVLDSQLDSLETLLSVSAPPRRSSAAPGRRAKSVENMCDRKRLSAIEETHTRQNSRKNMSRLSYDGPVSDGKYVEPQYRTTLPDIPRTPTLRDRVKSLKRSLSMSRKRIVKKSGGNIEFPALRKSFRLPKTRARKRSVSLKDVSKDNGGDIRQHQGLLLDDQNIVLRREASAKRLFADNRSSRVIGRECDAMYTQLEAERHKVGIFKCLTSYVARRT